MGPAHCYKWQAPGNRPRQLPDRKPRGSAPDGIGKQTVVYAGKAPIAERRKDESVLTFAEAIPVCLKVKLDEFRNEKHKKQWSSSLNTYAVPVLGEMPLNAITVRDVLRVLQPIWTTETETASRVRGRIESILTWAKVSRYRDGPNPADWRGNLSELLPKPSKIKGRLHLLKNSF